MASMEKLKKIKLWLYRTQDRVVIFGSRVGFSEAAYSTASFKVTSGWPVLPGQQNVGQNRL